MNETLTKSLRRIAWGWVLLHVNFSVGNCNLLPDWLGYIFLLNGLTGITAYVPQASLLFSFGMGLGAVSLVQWLVALVGIEFSSLWLTVLTSIVSLYFQFQMLHDLATLSDENHCMVGSSLRQLAIGNLLCCTALTFLVLVGYDLNYAVSEIFHYNGTLALLPVGVCFAAGLIITIQIAKALFQFKNELTNKEEIKPISLSTYKQDE